MGGLKPWGLILGVWACLLGSGIAVVSPPIAFNLLANAALESGVMAENLPVPQWLSIVGATDSTPIVIATSVENGLATGDTVVIKGVLGNTAANGYWKISVLTPTTFSLDESSGGRAYAGGGACYPTLGQPAPPGRGNSINELAWTPWYSNPAFFSPGEFFVTGGSGESDEVVTKPPVRGDAFLSQDIDGSRFRPGEHLCLSLFARMPVHGDARQRLKMLVTAALGSVTVYSETFDEAEITEEYRRFAFAFVLPESAVTAGGTLRVEFLNEARFGPTQIMFWTRPMLNEGDEPAPWTSAVETPRRPPRTVNFRVTSLMPFFYGPPVSSRMPNPAPRRAATGTRFQEKDFSPSGAWRRTTLWPIAVPMNAPATTSEAKWARSFILARPTPLASA